MQLFDLPLDPPLLRMMVMVMVMMNENSKVKHLKHFLAISM